MEEARLSFEIMHKFSILQLNKQLSDISGTLWVKSLQNARVDRCEFILLHEFKKHKMILPDKTFFVSREEEGFENEVDSSEKKNKKNYEGGLVLEPKTGFYDNIIIVLDFNSLYPSIIQQYNICFTTVERTFLQKSISNNCMESIPEVLEEETLDISIIRKTDTKAILPSIIEWLVKQRNIVKDIMKLEKEPFKRSMLDIKQQALKLSANSLYGFLGYKGSRFYSKTIAALITKIGRDTLKETVEIVSQIPSNFEDYNLDIIYGDTDSIMINTLTTDLKHALELGEFIKEKINDKDKILKIDLDHVFKNLLLLKKKKYTGLKFENFLELKANNFIGSPTFRKEMKGLDMVRRDWCELSKEVGIYLLNLLLNSDKSKDDLMNNIYEFMKDLGSRIERGSIESNKFIISKQLAKNIDEYNNVSLAPHLKVAKRMKENGDLTIGSGSIIPYIICSKASDTRKTKISDKAYHPIELFQYKNLSIDYDWYKERQILQSASRLVKHIKV
jgi:DNA polymerase alpha subunit A